MTTPSRPAHRSWMPISHLLRGIWLSSKIVPTVTANGRPARATLEDAGSDGATRFGLWPEAIGAIGAAVRADRTAGPSGVLQKFARRALVPEPGSGEHRVGYQLSLHRDGASHFSPMLFRVSCG